MVQCYALLLAADDRLTVAELHQGPRLATPLGLALLTACQSAQPGAHLPAETINLSTALPRTGCAATDRTLRSC